MRDYLAVKPKISSLTKNNDENLYLVVYINDFFRMKNIKRISKTQYKIILDKSGNWAIFDLSVHEIKYIRETLQFTYGNTKQWEDFV
jgi:hypothetical protein